MDLSPVALHPIVTPVYPPGSGPEPEAVGAGTGSSVQRVDGPPVERAEDTYEPSAPRPTTGAPEPQSAPRQAEEREPSGGRDEGNGEESRPMDGNQRPSQSEKKTGPEIQGLTPEQKAEVDKLRARDASVRNHEQAHVTAGGRYIIRRAQFDYERGPDGKLYAVGGDVQIDTSEERGDPEATIQKAQTVRRAALAPSDPSPQDQRVAANATQMEFEARMELVQQRSDEVRQKTDEYNQVGQATAPETEPALVDLFT